ncbi:helix-turn-helix domain-containing protein [Streptomyces sp. NPDC004111]|uniref:helix-turn-helix domain-containing protein n=1 Tax=Streptomyces sp. NPDC004111 TaxID=3364690 RepID=UPI00369B6EA3
MPEEPGPSTRRRQLAVLLRRLRASAGMTLEEAGAASHTSRAAVHRAERSDATARVPLVEALCRAYGAPDDIRAAAVELAVTAKVKTWWQSAPPAVPKQILPLVALEHEGWQSWQWAPSRIPDLLQTRAYAEAAVRDGAEDLPHEDVAALVEFRLRRQEVLRRASPFHVVLDEAALRRPVGGTAVMAEQLSALVRSATAPHLALHLQVLPLSAGFCGAEGGFTYFRGPYAYEFDVVHYTTLGGAFYQEGAEELARHRSVFARLQAASLSEPASLKLIETLAEESPATLS